MSRLTAFSLKNQLLLVIAAVYVLLSLASINLVQAFILGKMRDRQMGLIREEAAGARAGLADLAEGLHAVGALPGAAERGWLRIDWEVVVDARGAFAADSSAGESIQDARFREALRQIFRSGKGWQADSRAEVSGFWPMAASQILLVSIRPEPVKPPQPSAWRVRALVVDEEILQMVHAGSGVRLARILLAPEGARVPSRDGGGEIVSGLPEGGNALFMAMPQFVYPDLFGAQRLLVELPQDANLAGAIRTALVWGEGSMIVLLALGAWLSLCFVVRRVVEPLEDLEREVGSLARGGALEQRLPGERKDEIGRLTSSINSMLERIGLAQQKLQASEARYRAALEQSPEGLFLIDAVTLEILEANTALRRLLGYGEGEPFPDSLTGIDGDSSSTVREMLDLAKFSLPSARLARTFRARDGSLVEILLSLGFLELEGRRCVFGVASDLREQRRVEEAMERAERMEAVGQLAGGVAHDFNNLLTVILASSEMIRMQDGLEEDSREQLEAIHAAARSASQLAQKLLLYGRKSPASSRQVRVNDLIAGIKPMVRSLMPENIRVEMELGKDAGCFTVDSHAIEQAVINLLINARDAMPQGGSVSVSTFASRLENHRLLLKPEKEAGRYFGVRVSDTGTGLTDEIKRRLFEPFFTTKDPGRGTGLGLAMVYSIVKQHEGAIEVLSEFGKGSSFTLLFPEDPDSEPVAAVANPKASPARSGRIVLVEDEPMIRQLLARYLKMKGYEVEVFATGDDAARAWQRQDFACDLLITDIVMPGESSGFEVAAHYLSRQGNLPVILISGYSQELIELRRDRGDSFKTGNIFFLPKPFETSRLAELIGDVLEGRGWEARLA
jgi:PAS domain S-box-containing protein